MRRFLSYPHVVSTVALVVAMSGTAYAAATITGGDVVNGSLTGRDIKNSSVKSADVAGLNTTDFAKNGMPGARMERSGAGLTVEGGITWAYPMDTEAYDTGGMYNAPDDFMTVKRAGTYLVIGQFEVTGANLSQQRQIRIVVNEAVAAWDIVGGADAANAVQRVVATLRLEAGDEISLGTWAISDMDVLDRNFGNDVWLSAQWLSP